MLRVLNGIVFNFLVKTLPTGQKNIFQSCSDLAKLCKVLHMSCRNYPCQIGHEYFATTNMYCSGDTTFYFLKLSMLANEHYPHIVRVCHNEASPPQKLIPEKCYHSKLLLRIFFVLYQLYHDFGSLLHVF